MNIRENRLKEIQSILEQAEQDVIEMQAMADRLAAMQANMDTLLAYYQEEYMQDYDQAHTFSQPYPALNQDSIWNASQDMHEARIELIKQLVATL